MTDDERYRCMEAARIRAELSVQDLWLSYVALGGTGDAFEVDGYLQGLVSLEAFQGDVLAQALNESLEDGYRRYRVPMTTPPPFRNDDDRLGPLIDELLRTRFRAPGAGPEAPGDGPALSP